MRARGSLSKSPAPSSDGAGEGHPDSKRMKLGNGNVVLVCGFDEPDKPVEADLKLLEDSGCRLGLLVKNSEPAAYIGERPVFRAGNTMTRAMLITFLRSLSLGELVLSKTSSVGEALKVFEYEGIVLSGALPSKVSMPSSGLAFQKREHGVNESISFLCEKIADSIVQWPRLEHVLSSVVSDGWRRFQSSSTSQFTATSTRAWIRFAERPSTIVSDGDNILAIATTNPWWLTSGLMYLGVVHHRLSMKDPVFGSQRNEQSFNRLWREVDGDSLGHFFGIRMDSCKSMRGDVARHEVAHGMAFAREMREAVITDGHSSKPYARVAVRFVDYTRTHTPACSRFFSGLCSDESGSTPERVALKKALKARGIVVVRWTDHRDLNVRPLIFPPSWRDKNSATHGPTVLLSFENIM